jgi:hypothetical protein
MVKTYDAHLPDWIQRQASLGWKEGNVRPTLDDMFWSMLQNSCPLIFESYAIILHPFGINWKSKELVEAGLSVSWDAMGVQDFSWKEFFSLYGYNFHVETAYKMQSELMKQIGRGAGWPVYIWAPAEGCYDPEKLQLIIDQIVRIYGNQPVNYYYIFMSAKKWDENDFFYVGNLSEFHLLSEDKDVREKWTPTAIYPDTKEWCIVSEFDSPFTYVGGSKELIDGITKIENIEAFEITPRPR